MKSGAVSLGAVSRAMTVDATDEMFECLARSGEVPPYLPVAGEAWPAEAWAADDRTRTQRSDPSV